MVAKSDCVEKAKSAPGNKVSKPLMEKKRRARINQCLDQLKSLLESYYSTSIRKRKLEKADILELTVKHLRNLQKIQSCTAAASELSDYQTGFRSCLANVNQYLLMAENLNGSEQWMLSQLSHRLGRSRRRAGLSSTTDSGPEQPRHEEARTATSTDLKLHTAVTSPSLHREQPSTVKQVVFYPTVTQNSEKCSKFLIDRNEAVNTQHSVWRPW